MRVLALVLVLLGCGPKPAACPVMPEVPQGPAFLWKVHKTGGPTLWLFGTVHDLGIDGVPPQALAALDGAAHFASELGESTADPDVMRGLTRQKSGPGIDQTLPSDDWYDLRDALAGTIEEDALRRARPWYALILLSQKLSPKAKTSMDVDLGRRAKAKQLGVDALETWEQQISALDQVVTVADLSESIRARGRLRCEPARLRAAYRTGDLELMTALLVVERTAEPLLWARNRAWQAKLEGYLAAKGAFVAVGLAHMLTDKGLPAMLAAAGYTVERAP